MKRDCKDVERLSRAELSDKLARYERILDAIPFPLCVSDAQERVEFANAAAQRLLGENRELLLEGSRSELQERLGTRFDQEADAMVFARAGRRFQLLEQALPEGGAVSLVQDVTRWQSDAELLAALTVDAPVGMFRIVVNEEFDILYANETFYALHGYTSEQMREACGGKFLRCVHPEDRQYVQDTLYGAVEAGRRSCRMEARVLQRGGLLRWVLAKGAFLAEPQGIVFCGYLADITERRQAQEAARVNEARWRLAFSAPEAARLWEYDPAARSVVQSKAAAAYYAAKETEADVPASHVASALVHPDSAADYCRLYERIAARDAVCSWVGKMRNLAGDYVWTRLTYHSVFDSDGAPVRVVGALEDVEAAASGRLLYQQALKYRDAVAAEALLACEINLTRGVLEGETLFAAKPGAAAAAHYETLFARIVERIAAEDRQAFMARLEREALLQAFARGTREVRCEARFAQAAGRFGWISATAQLLADFGSGDVCAFLYVRDIDEQRQMDGGAAGEARRDTLTQLCNRAQAQAQVEALLAGEKASARGAALLVDINNFRAINAAFGHAYGNGVLREVGARLRKFFPQDSVVARWGGDEFFVFLPEITAETALRQQAARLCAYLQIDCESGGQRYRTNVSVGAAAQTPGCASFAALCSQAEAALAQAKLQGQSCFVLRGMEREAQVALREEEWAYWQEAWLWENSSEIIYIVDLQAHALLYLNRAAKALLKWEEGFCAGKRCYEVIYGRSAPCDFCEACTQRGVASYIRQFHNAFLRRDFVLQSKTVQWQGRAVRIEKAIDVTDRGCAARLLTSKVKMEAMLDAALRALLQRKSCEESVQYLLRGVGLFYGAARVCVVEIDVASSLARVAREWYGAREEAWLGNMPELPFDEARHWLPIFRQNEPFCLEQAEDIRAAYPQGYRLLSKLGIERLYAVPYTKADGACGFVGVNNPGKHRGDLTLLGLAASLIANEMQKGALLDEQNFRIYHDALTGARNRSSYMAYLQACDGEALRSLGVVVADVNGLKQINRNFGHVQGDMVISRTADILRSLFPEGELFRVNGDEFVLLCENIAREKLLAAAQSARRQMQILRDGVTLGYTWADADIDVERLVEHASELMLIEKRQYYKDSDVSGKKHRPMLVRNLKKALTAREFQVYLQPKISIQTGEIAGAEALIRRVHPRYGLIPPVKFVPMLERERIISYVDFFVFEEVCRTLERWKQKGVRLFPVSLNFSRATILETDLLDQIEDIYGRYDIPPEMIEIEITESIGEMERETIAQISSKIKTRGFSISLDDFGSKYTSMSMLSIMKFHVLKLDKSLVNNLVESEESRLVVRHVVDMCKDMRIKSVAEGVETAAQLEILREIGCDFAQGYLFNKPLPLPEFERAYLHFAENA